MTAADVFLWLLIACAAAGLAAFIALPFVYWRGMKQMDRALAEVFTDRDQRESESNVRRLRAHELHRRTMRKSR
jgi:hypothetical protein